MVLQSSSSNIGDTSTQKEVIFVKYMVKKLATVTV